MELGNIIGQKLLLSKRFTEIDAIIPLPLFKTRERKRGYNQAERLAKGVAEVLQKPLWNDLIKRNRSTATQTKKTRFERWENVEGIFTISSRREIKDLHLLVVDDVITTGATLEACAASLREQGAKISISTLAYAMK